MARLTGVSTPNYDVLRAQVAPAGQRTPAPAARLLTPKSETQNTVRNSDGKQGTVTAMSKSKSVPKSKKDPTVNAYAPGPAILAEHPHLYRSWLVPCPFCERVHIHGNAPGPRAPHCPFEESWHGFVFEGRRRPDGYVLRLAGVENDPTIFEKASARFRAKAKARQDAIDERAKQRRKGIINPLPTRPTSRPLPV